MTHAELVANLAKPGETILKEMTSEQAHMLHMVIGMAGEVGELIDAIKKHVVYQKPLDLGNVIEEIGDFEFYLEGLRQALHITREETISSNIDKLMKRYSSGAYSNKEAISRDDKEKIV